MKTLLSAAISTMLALSAIEAGAQSKGAERKIELAIEQQSLADALNDWAKQTGLQLVSPSSEMLNTKLAPSVKGSYSPQAALEELLKGTTLTYEWVSERAVAIKEKSKVQPAALHGPAESLKPRTMKFSSDEQAGAERASSDITSTQERASSSSISGSRHDENAVEELEEIFVTGTHIRGATNTASPVITIDRKQIERSGLGSVGEVVRTLPQNFNGGQNPGVVGARGTNQFTISGASTANLRGLGADSTLTLVNGHRLAYDAFQNGVDMSLIPLAAVERIEVLADGASAQYGSDAVAGVVNVILRRDFQGFETRVRAADSADGGGSQQSFSQMAGANWLTGNVAGSFEYSTGNALYADQRSISSLAVAPTMLYPAYTRRSGFVTAHQSLTDSLTAFADGLYTSRTHDDVSTQFFDFGGGFGATIFNRRHTKVSQYGGTAGLTADFPSNGWQMTLEGTVSSDEDIDSGSTELDTGDLFLSETTYRNKLASAELRADGPLFDIPSGVVRSALGAGYRGEKFEQLDTSSSATSVGGDVVADRHVTYVFGEGSIPLVSRSPDRVGLVSLDLIGAIRHENHSAYGSSTTPKIGLAYFPTTDLAFRSTWGRSFRAPGLYFQESAAISVLQPASLTGGPDGPETVIVTRGGNQDLKPETANSYTVGFDYSPASMEGFRLGATFYKLNYKNRILVPIENPSVALLDPVNDPVIIRDPSADLQATFLAAPFQFEDQFGIEYDPANVIAIVQDQYTNAAVQNVRGIDFNSNFELSSSYGKFDFGANLSWLNIEQRLLATAPKSEITGTVFNPSRFRARGSAVWQRGGLSTTAALNYVASEKDTVLDPPADVHSWLTFDLQVAYSTDLSWDGVRKLDIALSAINLFNREPPSISPLTTESYPIGYDSTNASALGRFISAELAVRW